MTFQSWLQNGAAKRLAALLPPERDGYLSGLSGVALGEAGWVMKRRLPRVPPQQVYLRCQDLLGKPISVMCTCWRSRPPSH